MKSKSKGILSDTHQLTRITILAGIVLVLVVISFGGYYYYDRYYNQPQPDTQEMSVAHAEQAVRDNPDDLEKRMALAEVYMLYQRYQDAITQAQQVLSSQPDNQRGWLVIGVASANTGKPSDAIDPLTSFVNARKDEEMPGLDKSLQTAAYYLGDSYLQLGKPQEAVEPLTQAVNWSQTDADAMYKLGMAYAAIQDYPKAVNMFSAATTFVPDFLEAYDAMAAAYDAAGKPDYGDYARGMSAYAKKDYKNAIDLLTKSAQAQPGHAPTFAGLGMVYEALGNLQEARASYQAAMQLDPNNFTASKGIERVEKLINK
jgi:tetratricopeptide (TPR) repeat protein